MKMFRRSILGVVVAEFVMQSFFLILSLCLGNVVYSTYDSGKGLLYDFATNYAFFAVIGYVFGSISHVYIEKKERGLSGKKEFSFILWLFMLVLLTVALVFAIKACMLGTTTVSSIIIKGVAVAISLGSLFAIAYFLVAPVLDDLEKQSATPSKGKK